MAYNVVFSDDAENDLLNIYRYVSINLLMPETARGLASRIERAALSLSEMPFRFPQYRDKQGRASELRVMPVENYCILYTADESLKVVTVVAIVYGARNLRNVFGNS